MKKTKQDGHHVVTGAFGYSGAAIARELLARGERVITLTDHPRPDHPLAGQVEVFPFSFDDPSRLVQVLRGAAVVYNTYWVRFDHGRRTHGGAVHNSKVLFDAAAQAKVGRFVHVSITSPQAGADADLPYFRGKLELERALRRSGLSHAIIRPTVLFGGPDVLINNIAWLLRRLPLFGVAGRGDYRLQPVHVDDLCRLCLEAGASSDDCTVDAVGPETFTFLELVRMIRDAVGSRAGVIKVPPWLVLLASKILQPLVKDVLITRDEIEGLAAGLLVSEDPPTGEIRFGGWLEENADQLGRRYASELARHYAS